MTSSHRFFLALLRPYGPWELMNGVVSFYKKAIDCLLQQNEYIVGSDLTVLASDYCVLWSSIQHVDKLLVHSHRSGIMPRILGCLDTQSSLLQIHHHIFVARKIRDEGHAREPLRRVTFPQRLNFIALFYFTVNQLFCFYRRAHSWREGIRSEIEPSTIYISHGRNLYPSHEALIMPHFGVQAVIPALLCDSTPDDRSIAKIQTT